MSLVVAISGCGGGGSGPQNLFQTLQRKCRKPDFVPIDTIPDDYHENIKRVKDLVSSHLNQNVYLMGYSMGGAIAACAAYELNKQRPNAIQGLIFLNTQTEGLQALQELSVPVLFFHGTEDRYFPVQDIQDIYDKYQGDKELVLVEGMGHDCKFNKNPSGLSSLTKMIQDYLPKFCNEGSLADSQDSETASFSCTVS